MEVSLDGKRKSPPSHLRNSQPEVARYEDYRVFLKDVFLSKKSSRGGFSYRRFSELAGLTSPNFLHLVVTGKRHLSQEVAKRVAKVIDLKGAERTYFLALVRKDTAKTEEERAHAHRNLLASMRHMITKRIPFEQTQVLSRWHHLLVRELAFLPDFEPSGGYVSRRLGGLVTEEEAEQSLEILARVGLLIVDSFGRWSPKDVAIDTGDHLLQRTLLDSHHRETLRVWSDSIVRLGRSGQERGLLNIPISADRLAALREKIQSFQDELIGWLQDEREPDRVVQLGIYLIDPSACAP